MYCVNRVFGIASGSDPTFAFFRGGVFFNALQIGADVGIVRQSEAVGGGLQRVTHHDVGAAEPVVDQPVFAV